MTFWEKYRIPILLAPTMAVIVLLFGGALWYGLLQSLGWNPRLGATELDFEAYRNILAGERYAVPFWRGLALTLWISIVSTVLSALIAVLIALVLRGTYVGKRVSVFLLQFNLPVPHLVAAIGIFFVLRQSGLVSRLFAQLSLVETTSAFPVLVQDRFGVGIILTYLWKEVPFVGVIVLAVLQSLGESYEDVARTLGANRWQRLRHVTLPLITPALLSASVIVFAFTFGAYEVPGVLGVTFPEVLPVLAVDIFNSSDLQDRDEAMALGTLIALIVMVLVAVYMGVRQRGEQQ